MFWKKILFLILILIIIKISFNWDLSNSSIDTFEKVYNVNVNCGSACNNSNQSPDVIVPVYSPWRTYYPWSWVYPYNWNYPYYWSQYNFW